MRDRAWSWNARRSPIGWVSAVQCSALLAPLTNALSRYVLAGSKLHADDTPVPVLQPGRKALLEALECRPGERVLEVGVGTGLSLPLYPPFVRVTGIDLSREMLEKARTRVQRRGLSNVEGLHEMDAHAMDFPDASFDKIVAMYVVSIVQEPARLLA